MFGMTDVIRLAAKVGIIAAMMTAIGGVFLLLSSIQVPHEGVELVAQGVGMGRAILSHYAPEFEWIFLAALAWLGAEVALFAIQKTTLALKFASDIWGR